MISFNMKPCPFCGESASIYGSKTGSFQAKCSNEDCGCEIGSWLSLEEGEDLAQKVTTVVKHWNERNGGEV